MEEEGFLSPSEASYVERHLAASFRGSSSAATMLSWSPEECWDNGLDPQEVEELARGLGEMARDERDRVQDTRCSAYLRYFLAMWGEWTYAPDEALLAMALPLPADWAQTLKQFWSRDLSSAEVANCVSIAMTAQRVRVDDVFRYFCGCCWRLIRELEPAEVAR